MAVSDESADRDPVEALAEEFFARQRRGERPTVDEYALRHPDLATRIQTFFPAVQLLEELTPPTLPLLVPENLGEFHIVGELGRGGMGIVYEAEQTSLGRQVALKVLPAHAARNTEYLSRFQREARTAAKLHHTNIVPVHGVGEQDGVYFLAMQLIRGSGLDKIIAAIRSSAGGRETPVARDTRHETRDTREDRSDLVSRVSCLVSPTNLSDLQRTNPAAYYRTVASLIAQAADALAYAHAQGVVHRDVKPGNLLLDDGGTLWVSDFGLAKASGAGELTEPGFVVGTPRYLAPERFDGHDGPAADVYALGATLYELLTRTPAFEGTDRAVLAERICRTEPARPRSLAPDLPRDLETVCLKCLEKDPAKRYTAADLATDLRRFLDGRPVRARRIGPVERLGRWARRNPVIAGLTAGLFVVLAVGLTTSLVLWRIAVGHRETAVIEAAAAVAASERADSLKTVAEGQRDLANERLAGALQVVDDFFTQVSESTLLDVPGLQPLRQELLQAALAYYQGFLARSGNDPAVRAEVATAHFRLGQLREQLATKRDAEASTRSALVISEELLKDNPTSAKLRQFVANCHISLGRLAINTASDVAGVEHYEKAIRILESLRLEHPDNDNDKRLLATAHGNLGAVHQIARRFDDAVRHRRIAIALYAELVKAHAEVHRIREKWANTLANTGASEADRGRLAEAQRDLTEALAAFEALVAAHPIPRYQVGLAHACSHLGEVLIRTGRRAEAVTILNRSRDIMEKLIAANPQVTDYPDQLSKVWINLARCHVADKRLDEAMAAYETAHRMLADMLIKDPDSRHLQARAGGVFVDLGNTHSRRDRHQEALARYDEARTVFERLTAREPEHVAYQAALGAACHNRGRTLRRLQRLDEAQESFTVALASYRKAYAKAPAANRGPMATVLLYLGATERQLGKPAEALAALRECLDLGPTVANEWYSAAQELAHAARLPGVEDADIENAAKQAVAALKQASARGFPVAPTLAKDEAFSAWRDRPEFQALLAGAGGKP